MRNKQTNPKPKKEKKSKKGKDASQSVDFDSSFLEDAATSSASSRGSKQRVKAPKDVYTLVLLLSFIFFVAATVLLYLDLASYK